MRITPYLTDDAVLEEIGGRLARTRVELDLTQQELARRAGVSRTTVVAVESGKSINLTGLLRILRGLDLVGNFEALVPEPMPSPLARTTRDTRRHRASGGRPPKRPAVGWGDER